MSDPVRVRFAPSPTGDLHVGNVRTAVFNWLFAKNHGGAFILRIEDTDVERSTVESETSLIDDLNWLGLDYDEGPGVGGPYAPYRQSERKNIYQEYADRLVAEGKAYPCFCTETELEEKKKLFIKKKVPPRYDGKCRDLAEDERIRLAGEGREPAIRFKIQQDQVRFQDMVRGDVSFNCNLIGDFIIVRSGGMASYNFCVAVDDALMRISHVLRGEDHLSNTPRQILILEALGLPVPQYGHCSIIVDKDKTKLKKRSESASLSQLRGLGYLAVAVINYLSLLGWSPADHQELMTREELIEKFSPDRCSKSPATYDLVKMRWINSHHLRKLDPETLADQCLPFMERAGYSAEGIDPEWLRSVFLCIRDNIETLAELKNYLPIFLTPLPEPDAGARETLRSEKSRRVVEKFKAELEKIDTPSEAGFTEIMKTLKSAVGVRGKELFMPVRSAMTGLSSGPELGKIFSLLPKETLRGRLDKALQETEG